MNNEELISWYQQRICLPVSGSFLSSYKNNGWSGHRLQGTKEGCPYLISTRSKMNLLARKPSHSNKIRVKCVGSSCSSQLLNAPHRKLPVEHIRMQQKWRESPLPLPILTIPSNSFVINLYPKIQRTTASCSSLEFFPLYWPQNTVNRTY